VKHASALSPQNVDGPNRRRYLQRTAVGTESVHGINGSLVATSSRAPPRPDLLDPQSVSSAIAGRYSDHCQYGGGSLTSTGANADSQARRGRASIIDPAYLEDKRLAVARLSSISLRASRPDADLPLVSEHTLFP